MRNAGFLREKTIGAMLGSAIGDALGELAFTYSDRENLANVAGGLQELVYTDDTAMAIGLAQSILRKGMIDPQDLGDTFHRNYEREPWRGYAPGPISARRPFPKNGFKSSRTEHRLRILPADWQRGAEHGSMCINTLNGMPQGNHERVW